jgi:predicted PurR-regulated permease PerM
MTEQNQNNDIYDTSIRLLFLALVAAWCLMILLPFASILLWAVIIALAFAPLHNSLTKVLKGREKLASALIVLVSLAIILIPGWFFLGSIVDGAKELKTNFDSGMLTIPPPSEKVRAWPLIGESVYALWTQLSTDIGAVLVKYKEQLSGVAEKLAKGILSIVTGSLQMIASLFIAGVLLVVKGAHESARKVFRKLAEDKGEEFAEITYRTVGNVVKGILGVAFIQALMIGVGFLLAGVPFAGLWTLVVFVFAIIQLPATLVVIPVVIWLFSTLGTVPAILWTLYLIAGGMSDNVLKPILLGKGAPVPMLVVFLGVLGGFMLQGFIGLFTGAIVMSLGYKLFQAWVD